MLIKSSEPFYFPGNDTGCLLIHGFSGSPSEMRLLGEYLADKGYSVLGIRLPGHGTKIEDLNRITWQDWSNAVQDGWHILHPNTKRIFLIGFSMGGALALYQASILPVEGLVCLSTPYELGPDSRANIFSLVSDIISYASQGETNCLKDDQAGDNFSYDRYPFKGLIQLFRLLVPMRATLPDIKVPTFLIHSQNDIGIPPQNMEKIALALGTPQEDIRKLLLENSGHVVTRDCDKDLVFESIHEFIQDVLDSQT
jgi:carboxylesterase